MCRLYGHISRIPTPSHDLLVESTKSLLAQSKVPGREQKDGWGVGWYASTALNQFPKPMLKKSPKPVFKEAGRFKSAARQADARIVIAHIRAASNPRRLPPKKLIGSINTQPFTTGDILFAHNGTVKVPDKVAEKLGPLKRNVRGVNDSEVYFWQFVKFYRQSKDVGRALEACMKELRDISKDPHSGLNALISDGDSLYAFCHYPSKHKAQLSDRPWGQMVYARRDNRLVVASEPMDDGDSWTDMKDGELLTATPNGDITRRKLKLAC